MTSTAPSPGRKDTSLSGPAVAYTSPRDREQAEAMQLSARTDRLISCRDIAGRRQDIIVFPDRGRVVMVSPPGETAVLSLHEVGRLRARYGTPSSRRPTRPDNSQLRSAPSVCSSPKPTGRSPLPTSASRSTDRFSGAIRDTACRRAGSTLLVTNRCPLDAARWCPGDCRHAGPLSHVEGVPALWAVLGS